MNISMSREEDFFNKTLPQDFNMKNFGLTPDEMMEMKAQEPNRSMYNQTMSQSSMMYR